MGLRNEVSGDVGTLTSSCLCFVSGTSESGASCRYRCVKNDLSTFELRLVGWLRRHGTARAITLATIVSCAFSVVMSYGAIVFFYGLDGVFGTADPLMLVLPIVVPLVVTPIGTFQMSRTLSTAVTLIEKLSVARRDLEHEVIAREVAQLELEYLARRDALTGVLNRRGFFDALASLSPEQVPRLVLATVDVDHFKSVNDTHGHAAGDKVLLAVAERLREAAGDDAIVARLGGDEFVAALTDGTDSNAIRRDLSSLDMADLVGTGLSVKCSVGVATHAPGDGIDVTLAKADAALYRQKSRHAETTEISA